MPQAERTHNIVKMLKWLRDVQTKATRSQLVSYVKLEVTSMGATERTCLSYIEDAGRYGLIHISGNPPRFQITPAGKKWLAAHSH